MLSVGIDGLAARLELIEAAEKTLDLQYFIFRDDQSGTLIIRALLRAADRGVRIRVLVDDGDTEAGDEKLFTLAAHPKIQVRVFNPFDYRGHIRLFRAIDFVLHKRRLDYRMHNKLMLADNAFALIGGRNIGDQYFQIDPASQFGDDDVTVQGPMVQQLSAVFDRFWNDRLAIPVNAINPRQTSPRSLALTRATLASDEKPTPFRNDLAKRLTGGEPLAPILSGTTPPLWAPAHLIYDSPEKAKVTRGDAPGRLIYKGIESRVEALHLEMLMITPYFVPSPAEVELLEHERGRGVRISLLTNSLEAAPDIAAHAGYTHYRSILIEKGVNIFEIKAQPRRGAGTGQPQSLSRLGKYALHAKLYVFDRQSLFVGSMNFDQRSKHLNTEIGLIIDSPDLAAMAAHRFEALTQPNDAYRVSLSAGDRQESRHLVWTSLQNGALVQSTKEPARNEWQRLRTRVLAALPLDDEL